LAAEAGLAAKASLAAAAGLAGAFGAVLAATFEAVVFELDAFAPVLAVLWGIALLLFLEDLAAVVALAAVRVSRARPLDALRLAVADFFVGLEVLFLRVFCDTACARNCHAPVRLFSRKPWEQGQCG
jgi:hypothetical protein